MSVLDKIINHCRLCSNDDLKLQIDLGQVPLGNNLTKKFEDSNLVEEYPLCVNRCNSCGHFQLSFSVAPEKLYVNNYTYLSGIGKAFLDHLKWSAKDILKVKNDTKIQVLDVGSNDGSALKFFKDLGMSVLGVDPSILPAKIANKNNINTINDFFSKSLSYKIKNEYGAFDVIISHNVLAHVEDLDDVFEGIMYLLKVDGLLVFEIGYFGNLIKKNIIDTVYHEHLDYHTKSALTNFLTSKGFEVLNILENEIQGGSLRIYCKKNENGLINNRVKKIIEKENKLINKNSILNWEKNVKQRFVYIKGIILNAQNNGKRIIGYGAPTKATLFLTNLDLDFNNVDFVVEDNDLKVGSFLPKTGIPIISFKDYKSYENDFIICFAWNFYEDIHSKLKKFKFKGILLNILTGEKSVL